MITRPLTLLLFLLISIGAISCGGGSDAPENPGTGNGPVTPETEYVTLDKESARLDIGEIVTITPIFSGQTLSAKNFAWTTNESDIVRLMPNQDRSVEITGLKAGSAEVKFAADDNSASVICKIVVRDPNSVVRILGIGNSFTDDAIQTYLSDLANAAGKKVVIARLTYGGAELSDHAEWAKSNAKVYAYWKMDENMVASSSGGKSVMDAVADENWDYISFQQQSVAAGQFNTYVPFLPDLVEYIRSKTQNTDTQYTVLQTWSFAYNYTYPDYAYYGTNQLKMLDSLTSAAYRVSEMVTPKMAVLPAGTAIQNGRTSSVGDSFCRDGYHLDMSIGRFTVACTWYEAIFGNVAGNPYKPAGMSDKYAEIAKNAARLAVDKPKSVSEMTG